ncbi:hypothetical protein L6J37_11520 [Photobacterium sp. WH77]|uniref:hypothetical protein n=1 Tax=unclassified Photobacterium TaxID=2628852 RepID=UPI001EDB3495|nr:MULTISPECIES: hypothetical protein [unclassified Photobacterium]MCG2837458.1 hypothetical protein [Photobacterium sp. WH77]MCG2844972.1 hypothetical protein [Photobacterium sp. WH80]
MTAEIAIYNKSAVALAADSAVTIAGDGVHKIYNGAEKLFALSKQHPVGIMVYDSGSLCDVPWEIIIKQYRKHLGGNSFHYVQDYADDFWQFLENHQLIIPDKFKKQSLRRLYNTIFHNEIIDGAEKLVKQKIDEKKAPLTHSETYELLEEQCKRLTRAAVEEPFLNNFDENDVKNARTYASTVATELCHTLLPHSIEAVPNSLIDAIEVLFSEIVCRKIDIGNLTGVVFAGFGENEYFPAVHAFDVHGFLDKKLRLFKNDNKSCTSGDVGLTAYAQDEEVTVFMSGISDKLHNKIKYENSNVFRKILSEVGAILDGNIKDEILKKQLKDQVVNKAADLWGNANDKISALIKENYIDKVLGMIEFLPKQDLAEMAESLVNLTAFKRKVSDDSETVGGPIDVAIISKGDGFIWVKRKHYFEKALNQHYFNNMANGA